MRVNYIYCPHCGYESTEPVSVPIAGSYANGTFVNCPTCDEETSNFDTEVSEEDEEDLDTQPTT